VAFLRFTRDRRGYENTFLLHVAHPGERPRVLYWYRTAPGVRVGRPALDEDAIRTIEEQHPEIDFDWPHILEVGAITQPEVEERPIVRPRRRPVRDQGSGIRDQEGSGVRDQEGSGVRDQGSGIRDQEGSGIRDQEGSGSRDQVQGPRIGDQEQEALEPGEDTDDVGEMEVAEPTVEQPRAHDLLEALVGREIATRLRARYAEIIGRIHRLPADVAERTAWEARAESLNPDNWVTPDEVLSGVQRADELFDQLRRDLLAH
jgi:hypothetical protein